LTGCLSRAGWTRQLQQRLAQPEREVNALMLVDLDGFRSFNELHGHAVGDRALAELAQRCRLALGPQDVLGRWSGDSFALLLQRYDTDSLLHDAQQLLTLFSGKPLSVPDHAGLIRWLKPAAPAVNPPSASAGLAWLGGAANFAELLTEADAALQQARRLGGARLVLAGRPHPAPQRRAALTDPISRMPNRAYCDARLTRESLDAERDAWPLALWLVDIRGLSELNARDGHAQGDQALMRLARAIGEQARLVDWTARVRASALAVVMPRTDIEGAQRAAQRLRHATSGLGLPLSDCLVLRQADESASDLLARAWQRRTPMQPHGQAKADA
jgi:diguanylate cyclase (GGDEF)-like protein